VSVTLSLDIKLPFAEQVKQVCQVLNDATFREFFTPQYFCPETLGVQIKDSLLMPPNKLAAGECLVGDTTHSDAPLIVDVQITDAKEGTARQFPRGRFSPILVGNTFVTIDQGQIMGVVRCLTQFERDTDSGPLARSTFAPVFRLGLLFGPPAEDWMTVFFSLRTWVWIPSDVPKEKVSRDAIILNWERFFTYAYRIRRLVEVIGSDVECAKVEEKLSTIGMLTKLRDWKAGWHGGR
jgi:hypothetical protein